jgi:heme-degrading monooxygenase HmoA
MFIAMNQFTIADSRHAEFEEVWKKRERHLQEMKGFVRFQLLKGDPHEGARVYISHSTWATREDFLAWTESEQFQKAHRDARTPPGIILGPPRFAGYEVILEEEGAR